MNVSGIRSNVMMKSAMNRVKIALVGLMVMAASACATAPKTGVRPAFEQKKVHRVAVVPFYSLSHFSLSDQQLADLLHQSEQAAVEALKADGFEVIEPRAFRQQLAEAGVAHTFDDGVLLRNDLSFYFEPARQSGAPALEVATLQKLYQQGKLPAEALLFGEVVYHTRTECQDDATKYNSHAVVSRPDSSKSDGPTPCIVSHFQAKLVYAPTGETMWFNRMLLQTDTDQPTADAGRRNMSQAVARTLTGPDGLKPFHGGAKTAQKQRVSK